MPVRIVLATVAAAKTTVSPYRTVTAPPACLAYLPVSKVSGLPLMVAWERVTGMWLLISGAYDNTQGFPWVFRSTRAVSPSQTESPDDVLVSLWASSVQVGEQPSALTDHREQAATTRVVVAGRAQMLGEVLDALGQERDLDLRRAGVLLFTAASTFPIVASAPSKMTLSDRRRVAGSRPIFVQASSSVRDASTDSANPRALEFQTSACRAVRRSMRSPFAPIQIGGYGRCTGFGSAIASFSS